MRKFEELDNVLGFPFELNVATCKCRAVILRDDNNNIQLSLVLENKILNEHTLTQQILKAIQEVDVAYGIVEGTKIKMYGFTMILPDVLKFNVSILIIGNYIPTDKTIIEIEAEIPILDKYFCEPILTPNNGAYYSNHIFKEYVDIGNDIKLKIERGYSSPTTSDKVEFIPINYLRLQCQNKDLNEIIEETHNIIDLLSFLRGAYINFPRKLKVSKDNDYYFGTIYFYTDSLRDNKKTFNITYAEKDTVNIENSFIKYKKFIAKNSGMFLSLSLEALQIEQPIQKFSAIVRALEYFSDIFRTKDRNGNTTQDRLQDLINIYGDKFIIPNSIKDIGITNLAKEITNARNGVTHIRGHEKKLFQYHSNIFSFNDYLILLLLCIVYSNIEIPDDIIKKKLDYFERQNIWFHSSL